MAARKPLLHFLRMRAPIQDQLRVEEALFRVDKARNWFIYNERSTPATIVMGISGKPDQLLHLDAVKRCGLARAARLLRRGVALTRMTCCFTL
jgi:hypothetical protein